MNSSRDKHDDPIDIMDEAASRLRVVIEILNGFSETAPERSNGYEWNIVRELLWDITDGLSHGTAPDVERPDPQTVAPHGAA